MRPSIRVVASAFLLVLVLAGCSGSDDDAGTTIATVTTSTPDAVAPAAEAFTGTVDEFYEVPDPLPPGEPGDVIRTMEIDAPDGEAGLRLMYHSTDADGDARAVTGVVYYPTGEAPDGGWPIVAWAHGTTGLAAGCAPSRGPAGSPGFGVEGIRVATDYVGLGPVGELHPYLSRVGEANSVVDSVAAVRSLPEVGAGDRWVVVGVSQGGHAALVTGELAAERLPDAELLGTVALAPGAELGRDYGDDIQIRVITTLVLYGHAAEDPSVDPADYLSPDALEASSVIETGCIGDVIATMPSVAASPDYFTVDPRTSPMGEAWVAENDPGQVVSDSPILLVQGDKDILVVPARTDALFARLCGLGQVTERLDIADADHDTVVDQASDAVSAWVADRFADAPAVDDC
ncbi:MAG: hypothetical protein KF906_02845 [Actinobacteria bacterium]|nr:hypothetical protein [Actinomycetota bacterium]